ncbi:protein kinase domain-containing protein [Nakamurella sp.]|uniref:protein kinase domain-containing protein n=1 Tax=Nakamurella sp. TaxID=1869182 RepID=UPI0037839C9A
MSLRPGELFAGYTIERELGAGGMGSVYLARHPRLPRFDALKLLRSELCDDPAFVGRFEREADMVAQLDHPNIVAVYDRGSADGQLWISMRFIDGTNAEKALGEYPAGMPAERAVRIVGRVASALDFAHRHELLHRDVKPANILLAPGADDDDESEQVFLSDFGVAKAIGAAADRIASLTSTGSVVATLDYASPEQIKGQTLDHRTDIYALGCVLFKLLTGTVPFPGDSIATRVYGHLNSPARAPSSMVPGLPAAFDTVVATAMAKEADDRYPTCRALARAAQAALTDPAAPATPAGPLAGPDLATTVTERPVPASPTGSTRPGELAPPAWSSTVRPLSTPGEDAHGPTPVGSGGPPPTAGTASPQPAATKDPDSGRPVGRRRANRLIIAALGVALLGLISVVLWAALSGRGVPGTAGPAAVTSPAVSSTNGSPSAAESTPGPVPGLPHSTPLPEQVLVSSRVVDGATNLYLVDAGSGAVGAQLTNSGVGPAYPILSPDRGSMIFVQAGGADGPKLLTAAVDGSGQRELLTALPNDCTTFFRPAWNPAEPTQIALPCLSGDGTVQVHLVSVDTGTVAGSIDTAFPVVDDLAFSADGRQVVYWGAASAQDPGAIYIQGVGSGADPIPLVPPADGSSDADPVFSPDGERVAFRRALTSGGQPVAHIMVVGTDGSNPTMVTDGPSTDQDPIWSPDGKQIAFKSNRQNAAGTTDNEIWVVGADGGGLRELGVGSPGHADGAPAWGHR